MYKNVKRIVLVSCLIMILNVIVPTIYHVQAIINDNSILIKSSIINITKNTSIESINNAYGHEANIITPTPHGGHAYTWYKQNYTDLIYIETNENEQIVSAGICANGFESTLCSYEDKKVTTDEYMQGAIIDRRQNGIEGCIVYNKDRVNAKKYIEEYMKSPTSYDKYLSKHSIAIVNQYLISRGAVEVIFDEELYDKVQRIEDLGLDIREYVKLNDKEGKYIETQRDSGYDSLYEALPNPIRLAATAHRFNSSEECKYLYMRYHIKDPKGSADGASIRSIYLSKDVVCDDNEKVELTSDEKEKYNNSKKIYKDSLNIFNDGITSYLKKNYNYQSLPLIAGEIYENKLIGATKYLNAIRAGAGLPEIEYDKSLSEYAQHKSVLTVYMTQNKIPVSDAHRPQKPDGVDDDFYNKAMSGMDGENLYQGSIITSISNALNDSAGDAITCGHRYNLLNPTWKYIGIGSAENQSCHKFSGYQYWSGNAVAWPNIGVTPTESFTGGYWSCKMYNFSTTSNTTIEVLRLNDRKKWNFSNRTTIGNNKLYVEDKYISFYNADLACKDGYVYQITIHNIDKGNGNIGDYTYRSVFKSLEKEETIIYPEYIDIDKSNITIFVDEKEQITPSFQNGATEIATDWSSSNESIVEVSQYGIITAKKNGEATITVTTLNGKKATCKVKVIGGVSVDKTSITMFINTNDRINAITTQGEKLTWKSSNQNVVLVDSNGNITAKNTGSATITVTTSKGKSVTIKVNVIKYLKGDLDRNGIVNANDAAVAQDLYNGTSITEEDLQIGDMDGNEVLNSNDAALIFDVYNSGQ